jgi:hypothetical protein
LGLFKVVIERSRNAVWERLWLHMGWWMIVEQNSGFPQQIKFFVFAHGGDYILYGRHKTARLCNCCDFAVAIEMTVTRCKRLILNEIPKGKGKQNGSKNHEKSGGQKGQEGYIQPKAQDR